MERFLDRFWRGFGRGFGEVLERFLEIVLISFSYYFAYHVGKDLGRDLEVIWTDCGVILDSCLNDFGGHDGMNLLVLSISFWNRFQMMRSLCQDECEADVKILRSRCQSEFGSSAEIR